MFVVRTILALALIALAIGAFVWAAVEVIEIFSLADLFDGSLFAIPIILFSFLIIVVWLRTGWFFVRLAFSAAFWENYYQATKRLNSIVLWVIQNGEFRQARKGDANCQNKIGLSILEGTPAFGLYPDPVSAIQWFEMSARSGNEVGQRLLGQNITELGTDPRLATASRYWLEKAASRGDVDARGLLEGRKGFKPSGTVEEAHIQFVEKIESQKVTSFSEHDPNVELVILQMIQKYPMRLETLLRPLRNSDDRIKARAVDVIQSIDRINYKPDHLNENFRIVLSVAMILAAIAFLGAVVYLAAYFSDLSSSVRNLLYVSIAGLALFAVIGWHLVGKLEDAQMGYGIDKLKEFASEVASSFDLSKKTGELVSDDYSDAPDLEFLQPSRAVLVESSLTPAEREAAKAAKRRARLKGLGFMVFGGFVGWLASGADLYLFGLPEDLVRLAFFAGAGIAIIGGLVMLLTGYDFENDAD